MHLAEYRKLQSDEQHIPTRTNGMNQGSQKGNQFLFLYDTCMLLLGTNSPPAKIFCYSSSKTQLHSYLTTLYAITVKLVNPVNQFIN